MDERDGFERYASDAPSEAMREIAGIALRRGLTLGSLARLYDQARVRPVSGHPLTKTEPGNVRQHFLSRRPRSSTILAYARALGIPEAEAYVDVFSPLPLDTERVNTILGHATSLLSNEDAEFPEGVTQRIIQHIRGADTRSRELYAHEFQKTYVKMLLDPLSGLDPLDAIFDNLPPALDLRSLRRPPNSQPVALWHAWVNTAEYFGPRLANEVAALIVGELRLAGQPTEGMEHELHRRREQFLKNTQRAGSSDFPIFGKDEIR